MSEDYISENIKLLYGDCLERMKEIPDKSIDMILCDLPYGITSAKWDIVIPFKEKIIENYLSGILSSHSAPPVISNESGVFTSAPKEKPTTLQEARKIAEALFKI